MIHLSKKVFRYVLNSTIDLLFPPRCSSCYDFVSNHNTLCLFCWQEIHFISSPYCNCCGIPFEFSVEGEMLCGECLSQPPSFESVRSSTVYNDISQQVITHFKYGDKPQNGAILAQWMVQRGEAILKQTDFLVPVPMHLSRLRRRKYNQAALLAKIMSKKAGVPVIYDGLIRTKNTPSQAGLSRSARMKNLSGAITANDKYSNIFLGKNVTLIDDVMTTGSTFEMCSRMLLKNGVAKVYGLTAARTLKNR